MHELTLRTGFEIELLAPRGSDRALLASEIAADCGGVVRKSFHTDSEPAAVPGIGVFCHLSPAFDVVDADGRPVVRLVDDITIQSDLAAEHGEPGQLGWYRILSDDIRLLRLVERHSTPGAPLATVLDPVAELFGVVVEVLPGAARVDDASGATVAVALRLQAGRERPCEVITPPIVHGHGRALERLLAPARRLGFVVPKEAAVHVHLDGAPFRRPEAFTNVVRLFGYWREVLWAVLETNSACRRLAPLPQELLELVERDWRDADGRTGWSRLQEAARTVGLTKYADVNLVQLVSEHPLRDTIEVRILPGSIDCAEIVRRAALVEALLTRCLDPRPLPRPGKGASRDPHGAIDDLIEVLTR